MRRIFIKLLLPSLLTVFCIVRAPGEIPLPPPPKDTPIRGDDPAARERLAWWTDARFGMFIHWGLYSINGCHYQGKNGGSEHMMRHLQIPLADYAKLADRFNPVKFDADAIASLAKEAGMRYLVFTAKHHDGFAMYGSRSSDYNVVSRTPWARDPVKELATACRRHGLKFGVYYSLGRDWEDPDAWTKDGRRSNTWDFPNEDAKDIERYFTRKVVPQVTELLENYGPIDILWFDTPQDIRRDQSKRLMKTIRRMQPDCVVNSRIGHGFGDHDVAEQAIPGKASVKPWETCMTLNNHWGYFKGDDKWKSTETVVRQLIDITSKGGNFLLNIGPTGEGEVQPEAAVVLRETGAWLKANSPSIHGAGASPLKDPPKWGRITTKKGRTYLHVFEWPEDGKLVVRGLPSKPSAARLLTAPQIACEVRFSGDETVIHIPSKAPDKIATVIELLE